MKPGDMVRCFHKNDSYWIPWWADKDRDMVISTGWFAHTVIGIVLRQIEQNRIDGRSSVPNVMMLANDRIVWVQCEHVKVVE